MRTRSLPFLLASVALAVSIAACGGAEDDPPPGGDGPADGAAATDADGETDVAVAATDLGEVLVDGAGMTLYLFTPDPEGESTCEDDCAAAWPPLTVDGEPAAGDGVDPALLGTLERSDGSTQVSYAGAPLYTWASDREPGDVTGQGVNDVWYVVGPDGDAITDPAPEAGDDEADDAGGSTDDEDGIGY